MAFEHLSHPYRSLKGLARYVRIFGARGIYYALHCLLSGRRKRVTAARRWGQHPIFLRLNSSDVTVFRQVFLEQEYGVVRNIERPVRSIIDGGANIGLTSIFLADLFPQAEIFAIEPEDENFEMLRANTANYPKIHCTTGALWNSDEAVAIAREDVDDWAFRVAKVNENTAARIDAFRLSTFIRMKATGRISLLKLDVEGAEFEILADAAAWIDDVDNIVIELHESIRPGCTNLFADVTTDFEVRATTHELTLACRVGQPA